MQHIAIVGGGVAGVRAAEGLRRKGYGGRLSLVCGDDRTPYDLPPLSKQLLSGAFTEEQCAFPVDHLDADIYTGLPAVALRCDPLEVSLADGTELSPDGVVLATGRRARKWDASAVPSGVHTLRSVDDCKRLRDAVTADVRTVILGAGFIGCEVAATLRGVGVTKVTIVERAEHPMPALGSAVGARAAELHRSHGVQMRMGAEVEAIEGDEHVTGVRLTDGECIDANLVLVAIGSIPNSDWTAGSGIRTANGAILCDDHGFVFHDQNGPLKNIVAAGDVAAWPSTAAGGSVSIEHWTNARDMGTRGAENLISEPSEAVSVGTVPTFWSDQYEVKIKSAGFVADADEYVVVEENEENRALVVEAHRGKQLMGAVVFNKNKTIIQYQKRLMYSLRG